MNLFRWGMVFVVGGYFLIRNIFRGIIGFKILVINILLFVSFKIFINIIFNVLFCILFRRNVIFISFFKCFSYNVVYDIILV